MKKSALASARLIFLLILSQSTLAKVVTWSGIVESIQENERVITFDFAPASSEYGYINFLTYDTESSKLDITIDWYRRNEYGYVLYDEKITEEIHVGDATSPADSGIRQVVSCISSSGYCDYLNYGPTDFGLVDFYINIDEVTMSLSANGPVSREGGWPSATSNTELYFVLPIPAAAWLFSSALIGLVGFKRKK
ncbi:hypothetical protein [Oceanicoccus sp. KOV_DT_Chl]|uniref:hypothetical protein n=1 Tax=Oceanicoccus sp. KOV_DT_Chl TaxID=1904639 RepID=UPI000C7CF859|nr:hypothetical protein [Oceanicoccus sp. KOV_DT_Chl]